MDFNEELRKLADEYAGRGDARLLNLLNHDRIKMDGKTYRSERVGAIRLDDSGQTNESIQVLKNKLIETERQQYLQKT
jgi:hypothetical protein